MFGNKLNKLENRVKYLEDQLKSLDFLPSEEDKRRVAALPNEGMLSKRDGTVDTIVNKSVDRARMYVYGKTGYKLVQPFDYTHFSDDNGKTWRQLE